MKPTFPLALNTSTIRCQGQPLPELIDATAQAGFTGIEPWVREIDACGVPLSELATHFQDKGLTVIDLIAFFEWAVNDNHRRSAGFEEAHRIFEMAAHLNCRQVAAPPKGFDAGDPLDLDRMADHYAKLIDLGREFDVVPVLEFWGVSPVFNRLSQALYVAAACGKPEACILGDSFHLYKAGSPFEGLKLLSGEGLGLFHINDYPADPPRETIKDAERVWPGDGVAPLTDILRTLHGNGYQQWLSLELFNAAYWELSPEEAARTGFQKLQQTVQSL